MSYINTVRKYVASLPVNKETGMWGSDVFSSSPTTGVNFIRFLARTGNRAAQRHFDVRAFWDPSANGGMGGEIKVAGWK